jgi:hypothetical protein
VGHGLFLANLAQSTGHVEELAGDLAAAEREYARSCTDLGALGESAYLSTVAGLHARVLARRGRPDQARAALTLARRHGSEDDVTTHSLVWQAEGLLAAAAGQPARARAAVADSLRLESGGEQPDAYGESCLTGADVEQLLGDGGAAREHLIAAQRLFAAKGNVVRADEVSRRLRGAALPQK